MKINPPELLEVDNSVRIQSRIEFAGKKEYLWYSVDKAYKNYLCTEKLDGFLVGLLPLAMKIGEDIEMDGVVSEKLFYNLSNYYQKIMSLAVPSLRPVKITCKNQVRDGVIECQGGVVTGFSAGIDSFCTIADHYFDTISPTYKITHFIFNNVGSHGGKNPEAARELFNKRYEEIKGFTKEVGIEFIKIDSNLSNLLQFNFQLSHVCRNASAVLQLQKLFGKYLYASTYPYQDSYINKTSDIAFADPAAVHLLSTETLECISTGCQYTRVEKTAKVAGIELVDRYLNVCVKPEANGKNCSVCKKCLRTLLTLEILGQIDRFARVFDLCRYNKIKRAYIGKILWTRKKPFHKEIIWQAKKNNFRLPFYYKIAGILPFRYFQKRCLKRFS